MISCRELSTAVILIKKRYVVALHIEVWKAISLQICKSLLQRTRSSIWGITNISRLRGSLKFAEEAIRTEPDPRIVNEGVVLSRKSPAGKFYI